MLLFVSIVASSSLLGLYLFFALLSLHIKYLLPTDGVFCGLLPYFYKNQLTSLDCFKFAMFDQIKCISMFSFIPYGVHCFCHRICPTIILNFDNLKVLIDMYKYIVVTHTHTHHVVATITTFFLLFVYLFSLSIIFYCLPLQYIFFFLILYALSNAIPTTFLKKSFIISTFVF